MGGKRKGRRVIGPACNSNARMADAGGSMNLVMACVHEESLMAPGEVRVSGGVVRIQRERVVEKPRSDAGSFGRHQRHVRQGAQIQVISVEVFGMLSARALDLRLQ